MFSIKILISVCTLGEGCAVAHVLKAQRCNLENFGFEAARADNFAHFMCRLS